MDSVAHRSWTRQCSGISRTFVKLARGAGHLLEDLASSLVPRRCALCLRISDAGYCYDCQTLLPWMESRCHYCATPLAAGEVCGSCITRKPAHQQTIAPFRYTAPISGHIQQLKYHDKLLYANAMANMLAVDIVKNCRQLPVMLVAVPLHRKRLRHRGYNQAALIAASLSKTLEIPFRDDIVWRSRDTASQTNLVEKQRITNVKGVFCARSTPRYHGIAVVDDVITSGATIGEVCRALANAGHSGISAWAIAKT